LLVKVRDSAVSHCDSRNAWFANSSCPESCLCRMQVIEQGRLEFKCYIDRTDAASRARGCSSDGDPVHLIASGLQDASTRRRRTSAGHRARNIMASNVAQALAATTSPGKSALVTDQRAQPPCFDIPTAARDFLHTLATLRSRTCVLNSRACRLRRCRCCRRLRRLRGERVRLRIHARR